MIGGAAKQVLDNSNLENVTWGEFFVHLVIAVALIVIVFGVFSLIKKLKNK